MEELQRIREHFERHNALIAVPTEQQSGKARRGRARRCLVASLRPGNLRQGIETASSPAHRRPSSKTPTDRPPPRSPPALSPAAELRPGRSRLQARLDPHLPKREQEGCSELLDLFS